MRPRRAADPAVEPKSIEPALKNSSALLEPSVCPQRTPISSLANSFSSNPCCLSTIETGLYVAQSIRISDGLPAARAAENGNRLAPANGNRLAPAALPKKPRRESMVDLQCWRRVAGPAALVARSLCARQRRWPRALAAFVGRPQAARPNRRYKYSLENL